MDYNPLEADNEALTLEFYGFSKLFCFVDKGLRKVIFEKMEQYAFSSEILITTIDKIEVPKQIESIASIQKLYHKYQKQNNYPELFVDKLTRIKDYNNSLANDKYKYRCLLNTHFPIFIHLSTGVKIEVVFMSYDDFRNWSEGMTLLISNKKRLSKLKNKIL